MDVEISTSRAGGGCGCGGCVSLVFSLGSALVMTVGVFAIISQSHVESDKAAIAAFEACPAVTAELGSPLKRVPWSMSCGEYEGGGSRADADWTIRVEGPKGTASGWYAASYTGNNPWMVHTATIDLPSGRTVTAVPCAGGAAPQPSPKPTPTPRSKPDRGDRGDKGGGKGGKSKGGKGKRR